MSDRLIRVLHIITRLDPGGSAENTILSAERVNPERFDSTVWTGPGLDAQGPPQQAVDRLGDRLTIQHHLVRPIEPVTDLFALFDLVRDLKRSHPDIVHLHSAKAGAIGRLAVRLAGLRPKTRVIYTPHGHVFSGYGGEGASALFTRVERFLASWCDAIVGLTRDEIREFLEHRAGKREQFCVIPSGVDLTPFEMPAATRDSTRASLGLTPEETVIGFIGRFEEVKGPDLALEAVAQVMHHHPDVRFLMVGDGAMRPQLDEQARRLGIADRILWTGWREDIPELLSAMDIYLLTSRNEGQGRVLVEAMASGLPIVAMKSGGVGEVVEEGRTGLLVPAGDVAGVAEQLKTLLQSPDHRHEMGQYGIDRAHRLFSLEEMIRRLEILYGGVMDGSSPEALLPVDL